MTTEEVLAEYRSWLDEQPDTPAKRWCLANPPGELDAMRAIWVWEVPVRLAAV